MTDQILEIVKWHQDRAALSYSDYDEALDVLRSQPKGKFNRMVAIEEAECAADHYHMARELYDFWSKHKACRPPLVAPTKSPRYDRAYYSALEAMENDLDD